MKAIRHLLVLLSAPLLSLGAQVPWTPPISVQWELVDIGIRGDSINGVGLMAIPTLDTKQAREAATRTHLSLSAVGIRRFLPTARALVDSAANLPQEPKRRQLGVRLDGDSAGSGLFFGVDAKEPIATRIFVQFRDSLRNQRWAVVTSPNDARELLAALAATLRNPVIPRRDSLPSPDTTHCKVQIPRVKRSPALKTPPGTTAGGRVVLQFVIDSAGVPLDSTVQVMLTTGPEYTAAVQQGFGTLRYTPAKCGRTSIPLLVQQSFMLNR